MLAHLSVMGLVAFSAAFGIAATRGDTGSTDAASDAAVSAFSIVGQVRAAAGEMPALRSTSFELQPDPNAASDPLITRKVARFEATPAPTALPTPVAPPPPAPDPKPVAAAPKPAVVGSGTLAWPVAHATITQYYSSGHLALDLAAPYGSTVMAANGGVVTWAGWKNNGGGYVVAIDHGNGMQTVYNHLSSVWVAVGQGVVRGQGIAAVGCTGTCTGPHVHFEVIVNGVIVNPLRYL